MKLSEQQEYLLSRLPQWYSIEKPKQKEPKNIEQARKVIATYEAQQKLEDKKLRKEYDKTLFAAQEAIYFSSPDKALAAVKALEARYPKK